MLGRQAMVDMEGSARNTQSTRNMRRAGSHLKEMWNQCSEQQQDFNND